MENRMEKFNELLSKFYDAKIFREVYRKDGTLICNLYEQCYVVFNLDIIAISENEYTGFIMNIANVKNLVKDPAYIKTYFESMDLDELKKLLVVFDEKFFKRMVDKRHLFESLPESKAIDLGYEERLKRKMNRLTLRIKAGK